MSIPPGLRDDAAALSKVTIGLEPLRIQDVMAIAHERTPVVLDQHPDYQALIEAGPAFLDKLLERDGTIYGVTTGYGDSCDVVVPRDLIETLPLHLLRFHGCGMGNPLSHEMARAVIVVRLISLAKGYSGVSWGLLTRLVEFLNLDAVPLIPEEGSVGASGDLTPLSYLAAMLVGEREVLYGSERISAQEFHHRVNLRPLTLRPKEGLAIMNGTAMMTALACECYRRADYLSRLSVRLTALASLALQGNRHHFDERLFKVKPHPGQNQVAAWIRQDIGGDDAPNDANRLQDRYSIRCAPHVIGVLRDSLPWMEQFLETEINSTNDNPVIDAIGEQVLHGGHFYGGHVTFAMDGLKNAVANLADLMDRQLALLVDVKFNHGLPANLSGASGRRSGINHGFKAVQIAVSAWTAEALKLTMPASVFSRSTECHNQDKVSMGPIAARDCLRILELSEQVAAAHTLATVQAITLRRRSAGAREARYLNGVDGGLKLFIESVKNEFAFLEEDRALEPELRKFVDLIRGRHWSLYDR